MNKTTEIISAQNPDAIVKATKVLKAGGLVVFPTDTLYGLGADANNPQAIRSIYTAKDRTIEKAIPVLIGDFTQLYLVTEQLDARVKILTDVFWPGALTLILRKKTGLPEELSQSDTLGLRMPAHPFALALLQLSGPLAVSSANISGAENPINAEQVLQQLNGRIDLIIDGGDIPIGKASTVVDCTGSELVCLREGPIDFREIQQVWETE